MLCGCASEPAPPRDAAIVDANADAPSAEDLGIDAADGAACDGADCRPFCVSNPGLGAPPTYACDAEHEGAVECEGGAGCGYFCTGSCWGILCDGPCGGLDAGP